MSEISFFTECLKFTEKIFEYWKFSKLPFKPDQDRYRTVMENISVSDIYYFREWDDLYHNFPSCHYDGIWSSTCALSTIHVPNFIDNELREKEQKLLDALKKMWNLMRRRFYSNPGGRTYTIYRPDYNIMNLEHKQEVIEIRVELNQALDQLIEAFEDFRDCGNEKFAVRISEDASLINRE